MTAQHAWRQGKVAAVNVAASCGVGERRPYRHRDLGFVVDLGGLQAAADPFGIPLSGPVAGAVTHGYHLAAMPGNRVRVAADWLLEAVLPRQSVQLGLVWSWSVPLDTASPELARVPGRPRGRETDETGGTTGGTGEAAGEGRAGAKGAGGAGGDADLGGERLTEIIDNTEKAQLAGAEPAPHRPGPQPAPSRPEPEEKAGKSGKAGKAGGPAGRKGPAGGHRGDHPSPGPVRRDDTPTQGDP